MSVTNKVTLFELSVQGKNGYTEDKNNVHVDENKPITFGKTAKKCSIKELIKLVSILKPMQGKFTLL